MKSVDAGETWELSNLGISGLSGRVEIATSEAQEGVVFISVQGTRTSNGSDMYLSENNGQTWSILSEVAGGTNYDFLGGQGWYDNTVITHPYNPNIVYVGGVNTWKMEVLSTGTDAIDLAVDRGETESFFGFSSFINVLYYNGGINTPADIAFEDLVAIELRFGDGRSQMAHRFTVGNRGSGVPPEDYSYADYVEVPFEVWDVTNDRQLMVSFRDQADDGEFNLIEEDFANSDPSAQSREYLYIHDLAYSADAPNANVTVNGGQEFNNLYTIFPQLEAGGTWDADNLPNSILSITPVEVTTRDRVTTIMTDAYQQFGGPNPYFDDKVQTNTGIHPDQHYLWVLKDDPSAETFRLLVTNDGGIYKTRSEANPGEDQGDWSYAGTGLVTTQYHGVDKMPGANVYIGGKQDNGTWRSPLSDDPNASTLYDPMFGGDGFDVVWNYGNDNLVMGGSQFNGFARSTDKGESWASVTNPGFASPAFYSPLGNARSNPDVIFTVDAQGVWRSPDFGLTWKLSPIADLAAWNWNQGIPQVKASDAYNQVVWAGSGMGEVSRMMVSQDGGYTFSTTEPYTGGDPLGGLSGFATHSTEPYTAFALFSFAQGPKVLRTTDLGQTWEDITGFEGNEVSDRGFPDVAVYDLVVMPHDPNTIWVGTEIGVVESNDNGDSWHFLDGNLPSVPVFDMKITDTQVVLGTHGRGIWSTTIPELPAFNSQLPPEIVSANQNEDNDLVVAVSLNASYDSTQIWVNGTYLGSTTEQGSFDINIEGLPVPGFYDVQIASYTNELPYSSDIVSVALFQDSDIIDSYTTDFEDGAVAEDFNFVNMEVRSETGFDGMAAHTPHPYEVGEDHIMMLKSPVRVAALGDAILIFDEVALVEKGVDGSAFGDANFWDYAIVEASFNGGEWFPVANGYDANANSTWATAYDNSESGTSEMVRRNQMLLTNQFSEGDIVFIRFRLFSDSEVVNWGWMIDNIFLQFNRPVEVPTTEINLTVLEGEQVSGNSNVGATDPDGDQVFAKGAPSEAPTLGSVFILPGGDFTYTAGDTPGEDTFVIDVCDNRATPGCVGVRVNVTVEEKDVTGYDEELAQNKLAIQAYPNPAASSTTVRYFLPQAGEATIQLIGLNGQVYHTWEVNNSKGQHDLPIRVEGLSQGIYLLRINSAGNEHIAKVTVK